MIDDDFESVFRKMIEHFMGSMGYPDGEADIKTWSGVFPTDGTEIDLSPNREEPEVETIDLGDSYMILVDMNGLDAEPEVHVRGRDVELTYMTDRDSLVFQVPFDVDIGESGSSFQNGILEVVLAKALPSYHGEREGSLQIE
jgi:HSP20 family molecular chaperone IbpA